MGLTSSTVESHYPVVCFLKIFYKFMDLQKILFHLYLIFLFLVESGIWLDILSSNCHNFNLLPNGKINQLKDVIGYIISKVIKFSVCLIKRKQKRTCSSSVANKTESPSFTVLKKCCPPSKSKNRWKESYFSSIYSH